MTDPLYPQPPSLAPIATAMLTALRSSTGKPWGDLGAPPSAGAVYGFLSRVDATWSGSMADAHEMVTAVYQAQCVALDSDGVEWLEHRARLALDEPLVVPGWSFIDWYCLGSPGGVRLDRDVTPHRPFSTPQWQFIAQPEES